MKTNSRFSRWFAGACSVAFLLLVFIHPALGATASWTDWTGTLVGAPGVIGTLNGIAVTYSGPYVFAKTTPTTNYWTYPGPTSPYDGFNGPPDSDIIALNDAGTKTITFSQAVTNPLFAWTSWQNTSIAQGADFGVPVSILSYAQGYWGSGTPTLRASGKGFNSVGEETGVLQLQGTFTSITFTDSANENWHGFTIGLPEVPSGVPEPTTLLLLGLGLAGLLVTRRRKSA